MEPFFELFDHTADMGVRVRAASLAGLLKPAADGLYAAIGTLIPTGEPTRATFDLTGDEPSALLRDYLAELLILFERDARFATAIEAAVFEDTRLTATAVMSPVDRDRSALNREVKAITYHELAVRSIRGGYEATVIVDI